jgi:hypothetical protein
MAARLAYHTETESSHCIYVHPVAQSAYERKASSVRPASLLYPIRKNPAWLWRRSPGANLT